MPLFQNCCCCVTLKSGAVMIGFITFVLDLSAILNELVPKDNRQELEEDGPIFNIINIILSFLNLISSIMLMYGSAKNIRWMVFPWILITLLNIVYYIIILICVSSVLGFLLSILPNPNLSWIFLVLPFIILACIGFYLWLCVIARFQEMANSVQNETNLTKIVQLQKKEIEELKKEIDCNKGPNEQIELGNLYACDNKDYYYENQENYRKGPENFYSEARDYYQN